MQWVEAVPIPAASQDTKCPEDALPPGTKPKIAVDKTGPEPPSRFSLRMTAAWWRSLQRIGMNLHFLAPPWPPTPAFTRTVKSTLSQHKGDFTLQFYLPAGYEKTKLQAKQVKQATKEAKKSRKFKKSDPANTSASSASIREDPTTYPVVVNFHGGGFTLGTGTDDARFARFALEQSNAIFVSVDYRLAPEYPFPTAVEDGADAILYLVRNAEELRINRFKIATSGFSAGANIAITAPLRLAALRTSGQTAEPVPEYDIRAVATWYPVTDYTLTRAERRATAIRPDQTIPPVLTNLFDASYLHPPDLDLASPYLSPSKASDDLLSRGIPPHVLFYTCEWDMLLREGEEFARRLGKAPIAKDVYYKMIPGVPHGWDKGPNPLSPPPQSEDLYRDCCERLRDIFNSDEK